MRFRAANERGALIMKTIVIVLSLLLLGCFSARATTYASNGSSADVQTKINGATTGDTVTIPAGSFTWATSVTMAKAIKLQGAGSGRVVGFSKSSVAFGTGTKTFTVQTGFSVANGTTLRISELTTHYTNYMMGTVTGVSGTTLTMNITSNTGSGTKKTVDDGYGIHDANREQRGEQLPSCHYRIHGGQC